MIWNYAGVLTDLRERDVRAMMGRGLSFARELTARLLGLNEATQQ